MGERVVVGSGFTAPINLVTVAVKLEAVARDVPHDAVPFETEQLNLRYPEDRAEWGSWCSSACSMRWAVMPLLRTAVTRHGACANLGR